MRAFSSLILLTLLAGTLEAADPGIAFGGAVSEPRTFTRAEMEALGVVEIEAVDHGTTARFRGVPMAALIAAAGGPHGKDLRGANLTLVASVGAADGYRVVFALPELDPAFNDRTIVVAFEMDGKPLPEKHGPFRIVVPGEKEGARWVRQVISVDIVAVPLPQRPSTSPRRSNRVP